jgi:GH24 family phage-related lysozyme (muramidase)
MNKLKKLCYYLNSNGFKKEASAVSSLIKTSGIYVIKPGDNPYKLSNGDPAYQKMIEDSNPGLNWTKLQIGQKINLPDGPSYPNSSASYSEESAQLIRKFEKLNLTAYNDDGWWAVGYGHRYGRIGQAPKKTITEAKAESLLKEDMDKALGYIKRNIKTKLGQPQIDALVSIIFNTGTGTFARSELKKIIDSGNLQLAGNKIVDSFISSPGHRTRRYSESVMFKGGTG